MASEFAFMKSDVKRPKARHLQTPCDRHWTMRSATAEEMSLPVCKVCEKRERKAASNP
jgi:hypothetical protein